MTNDVPGPATPGSGQPPEEGTTAGGWPAELVPPPAPSEPAAPAPTPGPAAAPAPSAPAPAPALPGTWGTPPSSGTWGTPAPTPAPAAPATPVPAEPAPTTTWGAPAAPTAPQPQTPAPTTTWGAPAAPTAPQPQTPAPSAWGTPASAAPAPTSQAPVPATPAAPQQPQTWGAATPPPAGGWGAPPAGGQPPAQPGQPGQWGAPPAQAGWAGGPGVPGGPPAGNWAPGPAKSGNGCLKACLIVGVIVIVLGILGVIAISIFSAKLIEGIGVNPDGSLKSCELISDADLQDVLGSEAVALPMGGLVDATLGQALDKRVLKDAEDCMVASGNDPSSPSAAGRVARQVGGDTSGDFARAKSSAEAGGYLDTTTQVSGLGDEAFCTTIGDAASAGVLVRSGNRLVYVSLIDTETLATGGQTNHACEVAQQIAAKMLR